MKRMIDSTKTNHNADYSGFSKGQRSINSIVSHVILLAPGRRDRLKFEPCRPVKVLRTTLVFRIFTA